MRKLLLFVCLIFSLTGYAQKETPLKKRQGLISNDSTLIRLKKQQDSIANEIRLKEERDKAARELDNLLQEQNKRREKEKRVVIMRIAIGLALLILIVLVIGLSRRRKK